MGINIPLRIWLIGGTSDSRQVAQLLSDRHIPWIATVVTPTARRLYQNLSGTGTIHVGKLTPERLPQWLRDQHITHILDASHPFATAISHQAIATGLPYLRYERPAIDLAPLTAQHPNLITVPTWDDLFSQALQVQHTPKILLTTGLKTLDRAIPLLSQAHWWARILPRSRDAAIALGFPADHLLLERAPKTALPEQHLWETLGIDTVLTKASGHAGGLPQKIEAAIALNTRLLIIQRPALPYPQQTHHLQQILDWLSTTPN